MRRQLLVPVALASLVLAAAPCWAANGNINMFFDQSGALCQAAVPCGPPVRLYVYALLQGASQTGITGAEYKVAIGGSSAADPGYLFNETFDPAATVLGGAFNPVDNATRGVNISWPTCQLGDGTKVLIETVDILNLSNCDSPAELKLQVVKHDFPSNQFFQCPLFTMCDAPVYTKICLGSNLVTCQNPEPPRPNNATCSSSGQAYVNPAPGRNCTVAVTPATWSSVKGLYSSN